MVDSALSVIKGIIQALLADGSTSSLVATRIYTDVPQNATFPYIVVSIASEPFAANDFSGQTHTVRVQTFSRTSGSQECLAVRKAALEALDRKESNITLDQGSLVKCEYSGFSDMLQEDDGKTWQALGELEVIVV